eukprot:scaffold235142_cov33-Tisochrysis_lutea.AAC.2
MRKRCTVAGRRLRTTHCVPTPRYTGRHAVAESAPTSSGATPQDKAAVPAVTAPVISSSNVWSPSPPSIPSGWDHVMVSSHDPRRSAIGGDITGRLSPRVVRETGRDHGPSPFVLAARARSLYCVRGVRSVTLSSTLRSPAAMPVKERVPEASAVSPHWQLAVVVLGLEAVHSHMRSAHRPIRSSRRDGCVT